MPVRTKELLTLLHAEDRRVDIESNSPEMMIEVGGGPHYMLKPVQLSQRWKTLSTAISLSMWWGQSNCSHRWSLEITDEQGRFSDSDIQPQDHENISEYHSRRRAQGDYTIVLWDKRRAGNL